MLFEFFTVFLMKKFLFKIFFQNKYYEWWAEVCWLTHCASLRGQTLASGFVCLVSAWFLWVDLRPLSWPLCPEDPPRVAVGTVREQAELQAGWLPDGPCLPGTARHRQLCVTFHWCGKPQSWPPSFWADFLKPHVGLDTHEEASIAMADTSVSQ